MDWITELLWGAGAAHTILLLAAVIATGILLGKLHIAGVAPGITFVLFTGIAASHFGFRASHETLHFVKEFGLILFVYTVGLQVGPGFFSSFRKGGATLNLLAAGIVLAGAALAVGIHYAAQIPMPAMVGILSGAVTNTPGLGAAQDALAGAPAANAASVAQGYAVAYPLGVIGIISSIILLRILFRINITREKERLAARERHNSHTAHPLSLVVTNAELFGKTIPEAAAIIGKKIVVSRICHAQGKVEIASSTSRVYENDKILVITSLADQQAIVQRVGVVANMSAEQWQKMDSDLSTRRLLVTRAEINGQTLARLDLRNRYGVNITRVHRAGIDLLPRPTLRLQTGDRVMTVGAHDALEAVEQLLGNKLVRLHAPNLLHIFAGICAGILLGSIPFPVPGVPLPVKLGLAGGPLLVAIAVGVWGPKLKIVTYATTSANLMLREVGICLFLACVGVEAGEHFIDAIVHAGGALWVSMGVIITMVPLLAGGIIAKSLCRVNYFSLMGLLAGSTTDPPALSYAVSAAGNDAPAASYASVYPLVMFLRIMTAQALILLFA